MIPRTWEALRCDIVIPLLKKLEASNHIIDLTAEWFKSWVGLLHPQTRDFAFKDAARFLL